MPNDFDSMVGELLPDFEPKNSQDESNEPELKASYSFEELWQKKDEIQKFLIPELLPANTVAVLIGEDGIGKTQITTQLCLQIALNHKNFLGLELNTVSNRCLIVATEDSRQKFTSAIVKQATNLISNLNPKDIKITFTEGSIFDDWNELREEIENHLIANKHDLLVIDALSDLFTLIDGEINSNSDARKILSACQAIANKYEVTVLLIHHAAKTKLVAKKKDGKMFVEKSDSQGAGAITQKPRTILALTHDPGSLSVDGQNYANYLHVVKANLMSKHFMSNAIQLNFDSRSLIHSFVCLTDIETFENPEGTVDQFEAGRQKSKTKIQPPAEFTDDQHKQNILSAFGQSDSMNRTDLVDMLKNIYSCGKNKIEEKNGYLNHLIALGFVSNDAGVFKLKIKNDQMPISNIEFPDEDEEPPF